jgi:RNA polymerase sigma factor (sigma-70 family)
MVRTHAPYLTPDSADYEDALQHARIGLWEAARRFDSSLGFSYRTLAGWRCRAQIQKFTRYRGRRGLVGVGGGPVAVVSLDDASARADGRAPAEFLAAEEGADPDARLDTRLLVAGVDGRRREVLEAIYLDGLDVATVARRLGVSPSRVSSLRLDAVRRIREALPELVA